MIQSGAFSVTEVPLPADLVAIDGVTITSNNKNQLQATPVTVSATADAITVASTTAAAVSVRDSGTSVAHVFDFTFDIPQGVKGETGATPIITPNATATSVSGSANPTVSVSKSGTDERPNLNFSFGIPSSSAVFSSSTVSGGNSLRSITIDGTSWNIAASGSGPTLAGNNEFTGNNTFTKQITASMGVVSVDSETGESAQLTPSGLELFWQDGGTSSQSQTSIYPGTMTFGIVDDDGEGNTANYEIEIDPMSGIRIGQTWLSERDLIALLALLNNN
jgi:hypothetical protein